MSAPNDTASTSSAPALRWALVVIGFLCFTVGAQMILLMFALNDPSAVAEPDYYAKAVAWDAHRAQITRNAELGWRLDLTTEAAGADRRLRVELTDVSGAQLNGATVRLEAFHKARRAAAVHQTLSAEDGGYVATLPLRRPGLWELRFTVDREGERFTHTIERFLEPLRPGDGA